MNPKSSTGLSRRDAMKLLGAAVGASVLGSMPSKWSKPELEAGVLPAHAQTSEVPAVPPTVLTTSVVSDSGRLPATLSGNVTDQGSSPVTDKGFLWGTDSNLLVGNTIAPFGAGGLGPYSVTVITPSPGGTFYFRAYATNAVGTSYGLILSFVTGLCLVEGTLITLADGTIKKIEDVNYSDWLCVWNFDDCTFDAAQPLWIKRAEASDQYNLLEFSDGSSLKTINQHRIFNKEEGMFTHPMTDDTPIGTTTFKVNGEEVKLVNKRVVHERVNYYNIITDRHINLFANGILTSCRYNNLYPIVAMRFVKDDRMPIPREQFAAEGKYYEGLRLAEQPIPVADSISYVNRLKANEADHQGVVWTDMDRQGQLQAFGLAAARAVATVPREAEVELVDS